jgi:hypothetical protein
MYFTFHSQQLLQDREVATAAQIFMGTRHLFKAAVLALGSLQGT